MPTGPRRAHGRIPRVLFRLLCAASALGLAGMLLPQLSIFAHFQHVYAAAWLLSLLAMAVSARLRGAFWRPQAARRVAQVGLLAHGLAVAALWWPTEEPQFEAGTALEVVFMNLHDRPAAWDGLRESFGDEWPDLLALAEARFVGLAPGDDYPYVLRSPQGGMVLFSRLPLERTEIHAESGIRDVLETDVVLPRGRLHLVVAHPGNQAATSHNRELRRLAGIVESAGDAHRPIMVIGDLNTTRWSPQFRQLLQAGELRAACCAGRGLQVTWSPLAAGPFGLAIDHLLANDAVAVDRFEVLPWIEGSDHRGLRALVRVDARLREDPLGR